MALGSSTSLELIQICSFLWLNTIPVCVCACVCIMTKPSTNNIAKQFFNLRKKKVMEGIYMYPCLIHVDVWKETNTYYKAIILQLKIKIKKPYYPRSIETKIWGLLVT